MNSVGDEPSGITGIKSGVRSQIGFWDSFYQKTTFNYWFETRYDRGWPRTDRGLTEDWPSDTALGKIVADMTTSGTY